MRRAARGIVWVALALVMGLTTFGGATRTAAYAAPEGLAEGVVLGYYDAINEGDFALAYSYLGSQWRARQSYNNFVQGYASTAWDYVVVTDVYDGPNSSTVYVTIDAGQKDGTVKSFAGSYTLAYEGMYFKIVSANIRVV